MKRLLVLLLVLGFARAAEEKSAPKISFEDAPPPAPTGSVGASLVNSPDGAWLSWVEPGKSGHNSLRFSVFDPAAKHWRAPRTIAHGMDVTTNSLDFPQLAVAPGGRAVALWTDGHGGARLSRSADNGATWSAPAPFAGPGEEVEKFSLTTLTDGRVLLAWLDGRQKKSGGKMQALYARVLDAVGPDTLVDPSVCDCCQTTLTPFLDGSALVAYRARTEEEVRDIRTARFRGAAWDRPRPLNHDDWHINGCPVNGPRLASDGGRVSVAWFTAADNDPRVLASYSPDAGTRFLMPLRLDRGKPVGHVDTTILHDGALLVTWTEADGSLWLRRVSPDFTADEPVALAPTGTVAAKTVPRLALVRDYAGAQTSAQLLVAFASEPKAALRALLVTVPEGALLEAGKNCDCAPSAEQLQGFQLRGTAVAIERDALRVQHGEVPGVLAAGTHLLRATPDVLGAVPTGREFLARIDRRDGAWWLFDVRLLTQP